MIFFSKKLMISGQLGYSNPDKEHSISIFVQDKVMANSSLYDNFKVINIKKYFRINLCLIIGSGGSGDWNSHLMPELGLAWPLESTPIGLPSVLSSYNGFNSPESQNQVLSQSL